MLEKNYKLAEMIYLEQAMGEEGPDGWIKGSRGETEADSEEQRALVSWASKLFAKFWGELTEMFIPLVYSSISFSALVLTVTLFHKTSIFPCTPEPVFIILVHGGRSGFYGG